jgi:hypothetical protein
MFSTEKETWKEVVGYEGIYSVSSFGNVRRDVGGTGRCKAGRILKPSPSHGYMRLNLCFRGKVKFAFIHILVAAAFIGECPEGMEVNHENGIKSDNSVENLKYVTPSQNIRHAFSTGLNKSIGETHYCSKLKKADISQIFNLRSSGLSHRKIGQIYGMSQSAISRVINGKTYASLQAKESR